MATKDYIAIDIGAANIKILEAGFEKEKIIVKNFSTIPTPANSFDNGNVLNYESIAESIKQELAGGKYKAKRAIVLVSGDAVIDREVMLPKMSDKELKNVIAFEAHQYFPVDLSGYNMDYKVIEEVTGPEGDKLRVFIVAVPLEIIDGYVSVIKNCGLKLEIIDIAGNALAKLVDFELKTRGDDEKGAFAILDIGAASSRVVILSGGKFRFERIVTTGAGDIVSVLMQFLNLKYKDAEELARKNLDYYINLRFAGGSSDEETKIGNEIVKVLNEYCEQVNKLFEFYVSRNTGNTVNRLILTGGGVKLKGLDKYISETIGIKTQQLESMNCLINSSAKNMDEEEIFLANVLGSVIRTNK